MLKAGIGAVQKWVMPGNLADPDVVLHAARVSVWGRWFIWFVSIFQMAYRPGFWSIHDRRSWWKTSWMWPKVGCAFLTMR